MMISQPALVCLESSWRRLIGRHDDNEFAMVPELPPLREPVASVEPRIAGALPGNSVPAIIARHETSTELAPSGPLTAAERRARAAALRALAFSRTRRFDAALVAFIEAASLDPLLDLTRIPAFWKLERAAHEAAVEAYLAVGRDRDAAVLRAQVRSTFRPKALRPRPEPMPST